jgi:hypothetical protein
MSARQRDVVCGLLFVAVGLAFVVYAWFVLPIGQAFAMGPGYFPIVLGLVLAALGASICLGRSAPGAAAFPPVAWLGLALIIGSVLFFAVTVRGLGLGPSLLVSTFMAAMATRQMSAANSALLAVVLTAVNVGVFVYALRMPYPVIGPWLGA